MTYRLPLSIAFVASTTGRTLITKYSSVVVNKRQYRLYVGSGRGSRKEVDKPAQDSFSEVPALSATVERLDLEELFLDGNALADLRTLVPHCMSSAGQVLLAA